MMKKIFNFIKEYKKEIGGLLRHAATIAGGVLIAKGSLTTDSFHLILGASSSIIGTGWSFVNKAAHRKEIHVALSTDPVSGEQTREFCDTDKVWKSASDNVSSGNVGIGSTATSGNVGVGSTATSKKKSKKKK
mgnify:CR=1 FL=1